MKHKRIFAEFWLDNYIDYDTKFCCLCGNTGLIKTKNVISPNGMKLKDGEFFCVCPNGRAQKEM